MSDKNDMSSIGEILQSSFDSSEFLSNVNLSTRAGYIWNQVNGVKERKHTKGVFVNTNTKNPAPILIVYIDSNALMQDFCSYKEVYLVRLAQGGLNVSDIQFKLSRYRHGTPDDRQNSAANKLSQSSLPQNTILQSIKDKVRPHLTFEEIEKTFSKEFCEAARKQTLTLPESLRDKAYKAILLSEFMNSSDNTVI